MKVTVKGDKLVIEVDLKSDRRLSGSGKTMLVDDGTDRQKVNVNGESVTVALNTYVPVKTA